MTKIWSLSPKNCQLEPIFRWIDEVETPDHMLVAVRIEKRSGKWQSLRSGVIERTESLFKRHIVDRILAKSWPGTELIGHPGLVFIISFSDAVREIVLRTEASLFKWTDQQRPPLPEDLCVFKRGASHPVFVSCTHESDAWLLSASKPRKLAVNASKLATSDLFVAPTPFFCELWEEENE